MAKVHLLKYINTLKCLNYYVKALKTIFIERAVQEHAFTVLRYIIYTDNSILNLHVLPVTPRYCAPRFYADSDIRRSVMDTDFTSPGKNACLSSFKGIRVTTLG